MSTPQKSLNKIIKKSPIICTPLMRIAEASAIMLKENCGFLPVVESLERLNPIGVITDRDIVCRSIAKGVNPMNLQVRDLMSNECYTLDVGSSLVQAAKRMNAKKVRRLVLVDSAGKCSGVISKTDLSDYSRRLKPGRSSKSILAQKALKKSSELRARAH